jgi:hypothetical protein
MLHGIFINDHSADNFITSLLDGIRLSRTLKRVRLPFMPRLCVLRFFDALSQSNQLEVIENVPLPGNDDDQRQILSSLARIQGLRRVSFSGNVAPLSREENSLMIKTMAVNETLERITCDMFPEVLTAMLQRVSRLKHNRVDLTNEASRTPSLAPLILEHMTANGYGAPLNSLLFRYVRELAGGEVFNNL